MSKCRKGQKTLEIVRNFVVMDCQLARLGISAVSDALESKSIKSPSTECILEALEICGKSNNCKFDNQNYLQHHGTAMGPK